MKILINGQLEVEMTQEPPTERGDYFTLTGWDRSKPDGGPPYTLEMDWETDDTVYDYKDGKAAMLPNEWRSVKPVVFEVVDEGGK